MNSPQQKSRKAISAVQQAQLDQVRARAILSKPVFQATLLKDTPYAYHQAA